MPEITFLLPCADYHAELVERAVASIQAQTYPCDYLVYHDTDKRGTGYARNRLLEQADSAFVVFLDADDLIEPLFAEYCLSVWGQVRGERYVYTNWYGAEDKVITAPSPCRVWTRRADNDTSQENNFHPVTALIPTQLAQRIGGFDELLPAAEDSDFYVRLRLSGVCGIHLNEAVFRYMPEGQRSKVFHASGRPTAAGLAYQERQTERFKGYNFMGCCDDKMTPIVAPDEGLPGDVLAQALWGGNRTQPGYASGRLYKNMSTPKICYIDPRDLLMSPHLWRKVSTPPVKTGVVLLPDYQKPAQPQVSPNWQQGADAMFGQPASREAVNQYQPLVNERSKSEVLKIARGKLK